MNYWIAVYFYGMNKTSLKFCTIILHKLKGSFKYFCRMFNKKVAMDYYDHSSSFMSLDSPLASGDLSWTLVRGFEEGSSS